MKRFAFPAILVILLLLVPSVAAFGPSITGVSPVSGPNNGVVTITITGTGLDTATLVRLNKCALKTGGGSQAPFAGTVLSKSATSITARFDITSKLPGDYDISISAPYEGLEVWGVASGAFTIYAASGYTPPAAYPTIPVTAVVPTATTAPPGTNSVLFETYPPGATIFLDGENVGTTPFTYYTNRKGTFDVLVRQDGYEKYEAKVTILEGRLVHFVAPLTVYSPTPTTVITTTSPATVKTTTVKTTAPVTTATTPGTNATTPGTATTAPPATTATPEKPPVTFRNSSITIPTPWATDPPAAPKSPVDPALALGALVLGIVLVVLALIIKKRENAL
jgi:hypothetical protein